MRGSPFFEGVQQVDVAIGGQSGKLPIFYYDGSAMTAVFPARLRALREVLPDPRFVPARLAPGLGAVAITAFEYRDCDIGPYNELAVSVILNEPPFLPNLPARALVAGFRRRQTHAFIHHLPVTTEVARAGGVDLYNYPKFIGAIDFTEDGDRRVCRLAEGEERILTLAGRRIPTPGSGQMQVFSHTWMDRQPQRAEVKIDAKRLGMSMRPDAASLELAGRHPIAVELAGLLVSRRPIQYQYMPHFDAILYGPEHLSLSFLERVRQAEMAGAT